MIVEAADEAKCKVRWKHDCYCHSDYYNYCKGKAKGKNLNLNSCKGKGKGKGRDRVKGALSSISSISSSSSSGSSSSCSWRVPSTCHIHQVPDQTSPYKSILNPLINCDGIDIKSQDASMPPYRHASSYYRIIVRETRHPRTNHAHDSGER